MLKLILWVRDNLSQEIMFQYISDMYDLEDAAMLSFNTSHVKVNQNFRNHLNLSISFNTSHVKVNPDKLSRQRYPWIVSIHPVLKLITKGCYHVNVCEGFQYIPC